MLSERWDQHSYWQFGNYKNGKHHIKNKIFKITFIEKQNKLIKIQKQKQTNKIKTYIKINTCVIIFFESHSGNTQYRKPCNYRHVKTHI